MQKDSCAYHLRLRIGKKLNYVKGVLHSFLGEFDTQSPFSVCFGFNGFNDIGRITTGSDGSSLIWENKNLKPFDMKEFGSGKVLDLSKLNPYCKIINKSLEQVSSIYSKSEGIDIGVRMVFEGNRDLYVLNWGDELKIFCEPPLGIQEDESIEFR